MALSAQNICQLKALQAFLNQSFKGASIGQLKVDDAAAALLLAIEELDPANSSIAKDAAMWRWFKTDHRLLWTAQPDGEIKWLRFINMTPPSVQAGELTTTSVMDHLEKTITAKIAAGELK